MKSRKAIKRLRRIETLLKTVIDQYDGSNPEVHHLLDGARSGITSATQMLAAPPAGKPAPKADRPQSRTLSGAARKRLSVATKKRWADAKRKGLTTLSKAPSAKIVRSVRGGPRSRSAKA